MYDQLDEIEFNTIERKFDFDILINTELWILSPYKFKSYFPRNITYSEFIINIRYLLDYNIIRDEINFMINLYPKRKVKNTDTILKLSYDSKKRPLLTAFIINKRIEYLQDYLTSENFNKIYIDYTETLLKTLYASTTKLINQYYN